MLYNSTWMHFDFSNYYSPVYEPRFALITAPVILTFLFTGRDAAIATSTIGYHSNSWTACFIWMPFGAWWLLHSDISDYIMHLNTSWWSGVAEGF